MDVLEYWSPRLDWSGFHQGALSDPAWNLFRAVVQLSHAHGHWADETRKIRLAPPPRPIYPSDSKYQRKKRQHSWRREIERAEGHMHRAAFLAAESIARLSYLVTPEDEGKPDWILYFALRIAVAYQPDHTRGRYKAVAFHSFDAGGEIEGDPAAIAARWLRNAGLDQAA